MYVLKTKMADEVEKAHHAKPGGDTIFGKILRREIPTPYIYEDDKVNFESISIHCHVALLIKTHIFVSWSKFVPSTLRTSANLNGYVEAPCRAYVANGERNLIQQ